MRSLVDLLETRAEQDPDRVAYSWTTSSGNQVATNLEVAERSRILAAAVADQTSPGDRVAIMHQQSPDYLISLFACFYSGCSAVPLYPPRANRFDRRLENALADCDTALALTSSATIERLAQSGSERRPQRLRLLATDLVTTDQGGAPSSPRRPADAAVIQYTSGSTSTPKGVVLTDENLLCNLEQIGRRFGHSRESVGVIWLPPFHDMGLIGGLLAPLYGGFPVTLLRPTAFLRSPALWLETISKVGATTSGGPGFAYDLCVRRVTDAQLEGLDLSTWTVAFNGSEPVRPETLQRFTDRFTTSGFRRNAFYPCYGLAEASLLVSGGGVDNPPVVRDFDSEALRSGRAEVTADGAEAGTASALVGCGQPIDDHCVVIVGPDGLAPAPDGVVGEIWVEGPSVAERYWNEAASTSSFGWSLAGSPGRFLRTGDHGFFHEGELFVAGRRSDLLIFRGQNHYPHDIERTVAEAHPLLPEGCGAAFAVSLDGQERLVVVHELQRSVRYADVDEIASAVRSAVSAEHELQLYGLALVRPGKVPRTTSNKVQRAYCRELFLEDRLDVVGVSLLQVREADEVRMPFLAPTRTLIERGGRRDAVAGVGEYLVFLAAQAIEVGPASVDLSKSLGELGLDSVAAIELAHRIEVELDVAVPPSVTIGSASLHDLSAWVADEVRSGRRATQRPTGEGNTTEREVTVGQDALWVLYNLAPESAAYNIAGAVKITAAVDVERLRRSIERLVELHPALRTTYRAGESGGADPVLDTSLEGVFQLEDASTWDDRKLRARVSGVANRPFDLEHGPIVRFQLYLRSEFEYWLVFACHQIAADFRSVELLAADLADSYDRDSPAPAVLSGLTSGARLQRTLVEGPNLDRLSSYWMNQLRPPLPQIELPLDRPRPTIQTYAGAVTRFTLDATAADGVRRLAERERTTPFVVLLGAFATLLSRYTRDDDVVIGVPVVNRPHELADIVGFFANTVALRVDVGKAPSFRELIGTVRRTTLDALDHQAYPFPLVVTHVEPRRDPSRPSVFQTMFAFQQPRSGTATGFGTLALGLGGVRGELGSLPFESIEIDRAGSQFDLTLMMAEFGGGYAGALTFNSDLFDTETIERLQYQFTTIVQHGLDDPAQPPKRLALQSSAQGAQTIASWRRPQDPVDDEPVHLQIDHTAKVNPSSVAIIDRAGSTTYAELVERAGRVEDRIREEVSDDGAPIAVLQAPGTGYVVSLLGVLAAGRSYLPLDPSWPARQLAEVLKAASVRSIITDVDTQQLVPSESGTIVISESDIARTASSLRDTNVAIPPAANACVFATSGTTGTPKLVALTHEGIKAQIRGMREGLGITQKDRQLLVESLAFAASIRQLFVPLCVGGAVVIPPSETVGDARAAMDFARMAGVTVLSATPSVLEHWSESLADLELGERIDLVGDQIRLVLSASERLSWRVATSLLSCFPKARVANLFGHTEVSGIATVCWVDANDNRHAVADGVPAGRAVGAAEAYALDDELRPVPPGTLGNLYVAGSVLAAGYVGDPAATAESFVPHPFGEPGERFYRTGDLVRHRHGSFEFIGRRDTQVKVRGIRVEPRAIERVLDGHPNILSSVVVGVGDGSDTRLVAYLETSGAPPNASELRRHILETLPPNLVPSLFVPMDEWPRRPNGKIDRRALPTPGSGRPSLDTALVLPRTPLEKTLASIWTEVLPIDLVGMDDNFFEVGGTSLDAMAVHRRVRAQIAPELRLVVLFQHATVASLARYIDGGQQDSQHMERSRSAAVRRRERLTNLRSRRTRPQGTNLEGD